MSSRNVLVLPDDSPKPILDAIERAKKSLRVKMFIFSDPALLKAVIAAHDRGVKVRVMLNPARRSGEDDNAESRKTLARRRRGQGQQPGLRHHAREIDGGGRRTAFVKSLNWATENLTETRDYAIVTEHPHEVAEIVDCFEADWHRKAFDPGASPHLIWCPGNGRERIAHFIDEAKHTLFVQNERYQDSVIIERLVRAATRGVKVHVMARPPHTLKKDKLDRGRRRHAHHGRRRHQDSQAQAPQAARQDAAGRRRARHRGLDQPGAGQFRRPARAGHRGPR